MKNKKCKSFYIIQVNGAIKCLEVPDGAPEPAIESCISFHIGDNHIEADISRREDHYDVKSGKFVALYGCHLRSVKSKSDTEFMNWFNSLQSHPEAIDSYFKGK